MVRYDLKNKKIFTKQNNVTIINFITYLHSNSDHFKTHYTHQVSTENHSTLYCGCHARTEALARENIHSADEQNKNKS